MHRLSDAFLEKNELALNLILPGLIEAGFIVEWGSITSCILVDCAINNDSN